MNVLDILYLKDESLNWSAINTISSIVLTMFLVGITLWNVIQVKKQTGYMKKDRFAKEMDMLVKKLYSKDKHDIVFQIDDPYDRFNDSVPLKYERNKEQRDEFWDNIKQNKYLGPDYLRSSIDNFIEKSQYGKGHDGDIAHETAKTKLFEAVKKRYLELQDEIEEKAWIIKIYQKVKTSLS